MMLFLLSLLPAAEIAEEPCSVATSAGWVAAMERTRRGGAAKPSRTSATGVSHALETADLLCQGDIVRNPSGSPFTVQLTLSGRSATLRPGDPPRRISGPHWLVQVGDFLGEMVKALGSYRQDRRALATTGIRGGYGGCRVSPAARGTSENYVLADVPVHITWHCGERQRGLRGTISTPEGVRSFSTAEGVLKLDVTRDCSTGCTISLSSAASRPILQERLVTVTRERLPAELSPVLRRGGPAIAMVGLRLVEGGRPWRLLGASLLWESSCTVPAAAVATNLLFQVGDPERFCDAGIGVLPPVAPRGE